MNNYKEEHVLKTDNSSEVQNPAYQYPKPPFPSQKQSLPGSSEKMSPVPDHGETSYKGNGRLKGRKAIITGGDSGIGKAVAIAFAREGADVLISYLNEEEDTDAEDTLKFIKEAGTHGLLMPGNISDESHCQAIVKRALDEFGQIDIIVNNAATQNPHDTLQDISNEEWDYTWKTNMHAMFYILKAAEPHLKPGSSVINTTSVNAYTPSAQLLPYAATKAAIQSFTASMAQLWAEKGIRVNCVAPGPVWTPLIPASFDPESTSNFGNQSPIKRPGQPSELAPAFVLLASTEASYMSGATIQVTGGMPTI